MKITRDELKTIITEEVRKSQSVLLEMPSSEGAYNYRDEDKDEDKDSDKEHSDQEHVDLARQTLFHMAQQAQQLHDMLKNGEELAPHVESALKIAAGSLEEIFKAVIYDKQNPLGR
tara:strand:+ start:1466 stop:1813 length:348 start_codon:yes stop_codon:yes gene_type:complete